MKCKLVLVLFVAIVFSANMFAQEVKKEETAKQKEVAAQYQNEVKQLQESIEKQILPLEGQKYRIDQQILDLQKDAQKKLVELQNKFTQLYKEAEKEVKK